MPVIAPSRAVRPPACSRGAAWITCRVVAVALVAGGGRALSAQQPVRAAIPPLAPKRALALAAPGCLAAPALSAPRVPRDNAEARRLAAQGREAALVGDVAEARAAFVRAAALNPADEQIAYDLGRAHEALGDAPAAIGELCRYLALSPQGRQAGDVQARILRLSPPGVTDAARRAQASFAAALAAYDRRRYGEAAAAFDAVLRAAPTASEALFDRALARIGLGQRSEAVRDLEGYLASAQAADDRAAVLRVIAVLRRPALDPDRALVRGLVVPGLGQFYTQRPGLGVAVLGATAAAIAGVVYERTGTAERTFTDPFGQPYTQSVPVTERPYVAPALASGAVVWLGAALEARLHAGRARREEQRATRSAGAADARGGPRVALAPTLGGDGRPGVSLRASF
jgi:tetratricopeptide (TPR) repeat protein